MTYRQSLDELDLHSMLAARRLKHRLDRVLITAGIVLLVVGIALVAVMWAHPAA